MTAEAVALARLADDIEIAAWRDLYAAAPSATARALGLDVLEVADAAVFVARAVPMALFNRAIGLGNIQEPSEAELDDLLWKLEEHGAARTWIHAGIASKARDLDARLVRRGLRPAPRAWAKMLREREAPPVVRTDLDIREIDGEHIGSFAKVLADAHGMPPALATWTEALVGRPGWRAYAAFEGDALVAGGMLFVDGERAWLGLGGTLAAYRGRGAQGALLARRIDAALAAGCTALGTETGEPVPGGERASAFANVQRAGFRVVASRKNYERP